MPQMRLDRFLANAGGGTRSEVKQKLKKGLVLVNGAVVRSPEYKIDPERDCITLENREITLETFRYYMLNKPAGYVSATRDLRQKTVLDLLAEEHTDGLFPAGRLDIDTEGLILLTDDGALAHELLSPKKHVDKTYFARIEGAVTEEDVRIFAEGVDIGEKRAALPAELVILKTSGKSGFEETEVEITIREGKFHQIKRMFDAVGKRVLYLKRISMGSLRLDPQLPSGAYRRLTEREISDLRSTQKTPG